MPSGSVYTQLKQARALIEDPENWCQGKLQSVAFGPDGYGHATYCAIGAIRESQGEECGEYGMWLPAEDLLRAASLELFNKSITGVNDADPQEALAAHENVLKVYDAAIRKARPRWRKLLRLS